MDGELNQANCRGVEEGVVASAHIKLFPLSLYELCEIRLIYTIMAQFLGEFSSNSLLFNLLRSIKWFRE